MNLPLGFLETGLLVLMSQHPIKTSGKKEDITLEKVKAPTSAAKPHSLQLSPVLFTCLVLMEKALEDYIPRKKHTKKC